MDGPVVIDLSPAQSPAYRERGVARHTIDFTRAVVTRHPELAGHLLLDPRRPPVGGIDDLLAGDRAVPVDEWRGRPGGLLHLISPFELDVPLSRQWPRVASVTGMRLVVTVHDLIPDVFPDLYLADPGLRRRWRARRQLIRAADHVFTLSRSTTADVVGRLGISPSRVTVIGAGCSDRFRPPIDGDADAPSDIAGLSARFVVYNGAVEPRKNLDRLLQAWARVLSRDKEAGQLVVVCRMEPLQRHHYEVMAQALGIRDRVLFTGAVSDETLVRLYQGTELMVFPSLYEGYGLPVVEALACGAPVMAARNSSLVELVDPPATFDPYDVDDMARAIERGLTDDGLRRQLRQQARRPRPTWEAASDRAADVYRQLLGPSRPPSRWRSVPVVAVVPGTPAWAAQDASLVAELRRGAVVDVFGPSGWSLAALPGQAGARGGYAAVIVTLGADTGSVAGLRALRWLSEREVAPVLVVAHELALVAAYEAAGDVAAALSAQFPRWPPRGKPPAGALLVKEAVARSARYLVRSDGHAAVVRAEVPSDHADRIGVIGEMGHADTAAQSLLEEIKTLRS